MGLNRKCCCLIARVSGVWYLSLIHHTYWSSESESNGKRERYGGRGEFTLSLSHRSFCPGQRCLCMPFICLHPSILSWNIRLFIHIQATTAACWKTYWFCMAVCICAWMWVGAGNCVFWYEKSSDVSVKAQKEEYLILFYSFYPFNAVFVLCVLQISVMYVTVWLIAAYVTFGIGYLRADPFPILSSLCSCNVSCQKYHTALH